VHARPIGRQLTDGGGLQWPTEQRGEEEAELGFGRGKENGRRSKWREREEEVSGRARYNSHPRPRWPTGGRRSDRAAANGRARVREEDGGRG
jgi:hypothetical protein